MAWAFDALCRASCLIKKMLFLILLIATPLLYSKGTEKERSQPGRDETLLCLQQRLICDKPRSTVIPSNAQGKTASHGCLKKVRLGILR